MLNNISDKDFESMTIKSKLNVLYSVVKTSDRRLKTLEKRKKIDTTLAGFMGLAGGALVMGFRWIFGR